MYRRPPSRTLFCLIALSTLLASSSAARAADDDDDNRPVIDARLEGVTDNGTNIVDVSKNMPGWGTGGYWVLFIFLAALTAGVLFKDARRSHLD